MAPNRTQISTSETPTAKIVRLTAVRWRNPLQSTRIVLPMAKGMQIFPFVEIKRLEASSNYCQIFLTNGKQHLVSRTLKNLESRLPKGQFLKIHQSHIVRIDLIRYIDASFVTLVGGDRMPISRSKKKEIQCLFTIK